jgi:hypothetical protein
MSDAYYPAYWIELAKRAYSDGYDQALSVIDRAVRLNPDKPASVRLFYDIRWFFEYWNDHRFDRGAVPADLH